ncbi:MAG: hypothetical protein ACFFB2_02155 [Promethearchaeota archaeon]
MFAFDLPFLFFCGIMFGNLLRNDRISEKTNWIIGLLLLFGFQVVGMILWFGIFSESREFMIIPFNLYGLTVNDFNPLLSALLFGLEPTLLISGEYIGLNYVWVKKS